MNNFKLEHYMLHRPRKRFGQNFLESHAVVNAILQEFRPNLNDKVVEIGPGRGALTKPLLNNLANLIAIEIDSDLSEQLELIPMAFKLQLINADAMKFDYAKLGERLRIIGNLPYNISTPLLLHILSFASYIDDLHFMLQKEVVARLSAAPGCKAYGRLSVIVQYFCRVEPLFTVPATAFNPVPKVESAMLRLIPYQVSPYEPLISFAGLERLVAHAFAMRRKTLANNLKPLLSRAELSAIDIDPGLRPEQISVADYVKIANYIYRS